MSWLMRNGTGRNNIAWGGGSTTNGQYLRRTGTSRNNIAYITINNTNNTYNILERTSTGRNNIRWDNLTFSFGGDLTKISGVMDVISSYSSHSGSITGHANVVYDTEGVFCSNIRFTRNTISFGVADGKRLVLSAKVPYKYTFGLVNTSPSVVSTELTKFKTMGFQGDNTVNITGRSSSVYYDMSGSNGTVSYIELASRLMVSSYSNSVLVFS